MKKAFLRFTLFLLVYLPIRSIETAQTVDIPDPNLRDYIERVLDKAAGDPITVTEMTTLTFLDPWGEDISDLTGLDYAINLTDLNLNRNSISDISPVAGLTSLTSLHLGGSSISDISPVTGLTNLTDLTLFENSILDISAVAGLTNLTELFLQDNSISDISVLMGLTNLEWLRLSDNSISDISALAGLTNLMGFYIDGNSISDISAVTNLTNLKSLDLSYNSVFDLSPLVANTGLGPKSGVRVGGNPLSNLSLHMRIPTLQERGVRVRFAETELLRNYPNPFYLETWIPYRLAENASVTLTIYNQSGRLIRTLGVGHQIAAIYESRPNAAYWDGRNELGERVASGIYFYHLSAGDSSITRKMVILR